MAAVALAPPTIARLSAAIILATYDKQVFVIHNEEFQCYLGIENP